MRGLSSVVVFAFFLLLLALMALQLRLQSDARAAQESLFRQERAHAWELEFTDAVRSILRSAQGKGREEKVADAARKLVRLEEDLEERWRQDGSEVELWAGSASEAELQRLPSRLSENCLKCPSCKDWGAPAFDFRGKPVLFVQGFLDYAYSENRVRVSRTGSAFLPELYAASFSSRRFVLGASVCWKGAAFVFLVPEGFS